MPPMAEAASDIAAGLYAWRDRIARAEDESTGYVLSRNLLQKLAMQMPTSASKVKSFCNTRSVVTALVTSVSHQR
jgi:exosome complex exonuclease RRP6